LGGDDYDINEEYWSPRVEGCKASARDCLALEDGGPEFSESAKYFSLYYGSQDLGKPWNGFTGILKF
jgi:hypothetical protein